ncbi:MAG: Rossmann-like and DUF2520 domain-containing protein [Ignavibacteriaceae bacterium]
MLFKDPQIVIIGAGKLANSLAPALVKGGFRLSAVISRTLNSAALLARKTGCKIYSDKIDDIPNSADVFFITVPDAEIQKTAKILSSLQLDFRSSVFIHCSGSLDVSRLNSLKAKKAKTASFHIMQSFPSIKTARLKNSYAAIETQDKNTEGFLFYISDKLKLKAFKLDSSKKTAYHLAGVFASNFLTGNFQSSVEIFGKSKDITSDISEILYPTAHTTLKNIRKESPALALSGPVDRGETNTVKNHIKEIKSLKLTSVVKKKLILLSYITQSLLLIDLCEEKYGKLKPGHSELKEYLSGELKRIKF